MKPEHPIEAHCGPIETPAAAGLPKNDRACGIRGVSVLFGWGQPVDMNVEMAALMGRFHLY